MTFLWKFIKAVYQHPLKNSDMTGIYALTFFLLLKAKIVEMYIIQEIHNHISSKKIPIYNSFSLVFIN